MRKNPKEEAVKKMFSQKLQEMLERRFPGMKTIEKAFKILEHLDPETAATCITRKDMADAVRVYLKWINGESMPKQYSDMLQLCDMLGCDISFLLGQSTEWNAQVSGAATLLGISENAVEKIKNYGHNQKLLLCEMTYEEDLLLKALKIFHYAVRFSDGYFAWSKTGTDEPHKIETSMSKKLFRQAALSDLSDILDDLDSRYSAWRLSDRLKLEMTDNELRP